MSFVTPSMLAEQHQPVSAVHVPYPISWADEERDITAWLGNELQVEAFNKLYSLVDKVNRCDSPELLQDWRYLQSSDHFYYMSTKFFSDGSIHTYSNPFETPYDAFINYMNVLSDFSSRLSACAPDNDVDLEIARLNRIIEEKDLLIGKYEKELQTVNLKSKQKITTSSKPEKPKPAKSRINETKLSVKGSDAKSLKKVVKKVEKKPKSTQKRTLKKK
jgi:alpha-amylase